MISKEWWVFSVSYDWYWYCLHGEAGAVVITLFPLLGFSPIYLPTALPATCPGLVKQNLEDSFSRSELYAPSRLPHCIQHTFNPRVGRRIQLHIFALTKIDGSVPNPPISPSPAYLPLARRRECCSCLARFFKSCLRRFTPLGRFITCYWIDRSLHSQRALGAAINLELHALMSADIASMRWSGDEDGG